MASTIKTWGFELKSIITLRHEFFSILFGCPHGAGKLGARAKCILFSDFRALGSNPATILRHPVSGDAKQGKHRES
jgi:hypothetical protein